MKKGFIFSMLVLAGAAFQHCTDEVDHVTTSEVSFSANLLSSLDVSASKNPVSSITTVHLILEKSDGTTALRKDLSVSGQGDQITTQTVKLVQGEYRIREFSARNSEGTKLYELTINHPTSCRPNENVLMTFYAGGATKSISLSIHSLATPGTGTRIGG